ncbi:hypothetical protein HPB52_025386 [Rhipicephalus sanguineus]|uniref:Uncharacterized protein n=1 Tax=Rhipicephalus sanguineus TaxID=34632 RepID=A0A9D4YRH4_RHISA|nr:hypothetical protein HPB52_025386 [Rhipicephalus sanguineus]
MHTTTPSTPCRGGECQEHGPLTTSARKRRAVKRQADAKKREAEAQKRRAEADAAALGIQQCADRPLSALHHPDWRNRTLTESDTGKINDFASPSEGSIDRSPACRRMPCKRFVKHFCGEPKLSRHFQ